MNQSSTPWRRFGFLLLHFAAAVILAAVLCSIAQTQLNLRHLPSFGLDVDLATRARSTLHDLMHFAPKLAGLIAAAFLLAFLANAGLSAWRRKKSVLLTALAAAVAMLAMLLIMRQVLGLQPIASARDTLGLLVFSACGACAGVLFARLRQQ
jgi:hypothetical protein